MKQSPSAESICAGPGRSSPLAAALPGAFKKWVKKHVPRAVLDQMRRSRAVLAIYDRVAPAIKRLLLRGATLDEIYGEDYFSMIDLTTGRSAEILSDSICQHLQPGSVLDIGCGTGSLIERLRNRGVKVQGIEHAKSALTCCRRQGLDVLDIDLTDPSAVTKKHGHFDLAICMEVGHQLPPQSADGFVAFICLQSDSILFSADSGGEDRLPLNPCPASYWIAKFQSRGFLFDQEMSARFRLEWEMNQTAPWFFRFPMVFRKLEAAYDLSTNHHPRP